MNASEPQPGAGPTLAISATLHVFFAQHPELTTLPLEWTFAERDGISASLRGRDPDTSRIASLLASLLGVEVTGGETTLNGAPSLARYVTADLGGYEFFFGGYQPLAKDGAQ